MRVLHCSDVRVGAAFPQAPELAETLRDARLQALRDIVTLARRDGVDAIVLAGNTLAHPRLPLKTIHEVASILSSSPMPVYLLPGETDPWGPDSPYAREGVWKEPVHVLRESVLPGTRIGVGCGVTPPPGDFERVLMGGSPTSKTEGIAHWSGPPEPYDWGQEQGQVLIGGERVETGRFRWFDWEREADAVARDLPSLPAESTLLRLTVRGSLSTCDWLELRTVLDRQRFVYLEVHDKIGLKPGSVSQHPLLRRLEETLLARAGEPTLGEIPDEAEIAREALGQLARLLSVCPKGDLS